MCDYPVHVTRLAVTTVVAQAEHTQKKGRLMNCILCLLVLCAVMTVILLLKVIV